MVQRTKVFRGKPIGIEPDRIRKSSRHCQKGTGPAPESSQNQRLPASRRLLGQSLELLPDFESQGMGFSPSPFDRPRGKRPTMSPLDPISYGARIGPSSTLTAKDIACSRLSITSHAISWPGALSNRSPNVMSKIFSSSPLSARESNIALRSLCFAWIADPRIWLTAQRK